MSTTLTIDVRPIHIRDGVPASCHWCAVALATRDALRKGGYQFHEVVVMADPDNFEGMTVKPDPWGKPYYFRLPSEALEFVRDFDSFDGCAPGDDRDELDPITFTVRTKSKMRKREEDSDAS